MRSRERRSSPSPIADRGGKTLGVERTLAKAGGEAEEAKNAQVVLANALAGVADEAHAPRCEIGKAADRIVDEAVAVERERIDREIPAARVRVEVPPENDLRVAPVGLDVLSQRRRLEGASLGDHGHGPVGETRGDRPEAGRFGAAPHRLGNGGRRKVDLPDGQAEREIAHRAADDPRFLAVAVERVENLCKRAAFEPFAVAKPPVVEPRQAGHSNRPGTSTPFSTCAGT